MTGRRMSSMLWKNSAPAGPARNRWAPHIPDFLWSFVGSADLMRLSLPKGAHAGLSRAAYRKFGVSRVFCEMWEGSKWAGTPPRAEQFPKGGKPTLERRVTRNFPPTSREKREIWDTHLLAARLTF